MNYCKRQGKANANSAQLTTAIMADQQMQEKQPDELDND